MLRHIEGVVVFPGTVSAADPFLAIRTPTGQRLWLDVRQLARGAPPLNAGDRVAVAAYATTRTDVVVPRDLVRRYSVTGLEPLPLTTIEALLGRWRGRWQAADGAYGGSVELLVARVPQRDAVVGQFTFISGAISRTLRHEAHLENGAARFPLLADGRIVLEAGRDAQELSLPRPRRLFGSWVEHGGSFPVEHGMVQLVRAF